jgi:septum formation protein
MKIILASASPRRNEMLSRLRIPFEKMVVSCREKNGLGEESDSFESIAMENALAKARCAFGLIEERDEGVVIGADTIVVIGGEILGKPEGAEEAVLMMEKLSGSVHRVITGIALVKLPGGETFVDYEETDVTFRKLSPEEIKMYVSSGEGADKAGAYGIQKLGALLIEKVDGDYNNVVGLPIMKLCLMLRPLGIDLFKVAAESEKGW